MGLTGRKRRAFYGALAAVLFFLCAYGAAAGMLWLLPWSCERLGAPQKLTAVLGAFREAGLLPGWLGLGASLVFGGLFALLYGKRNGGWLVPAGLFLFLLFLMAVRVNRVPVFTGALAVIGALRGGALDGL